MSSNFIFVRDQKCLQSELRSPGPGQLQALLFPQEQRNHNQSSKVTNYPQLFTLQQGEAQRDLREIHNDTQQSERPRSDHLRN